MDYIPHGGLTAANGFDCAHYTDIMLYNLNGPGFPYEGEGMFSNNSTFKTRKFVINELDKFTKAILKLAWINSLYIIKIWQEVILWMFW